MSRTIVLLINQFNDYYNRKANCLEAKATLDALCSACNVAATYPPYNRYNNIVDWYEAVLRWLRRVRIIA